MGSHLPCNESFEGSSLIRAFLYVVVISQFVGKCLCILYNYHRTDLQNLCGLYPLNYCVTDAGLLVCCCYLFSTHQSDVDVENSVYVNNPASVDEMELLQKWEQRCRKLTKSLHFFSCNLLGFFLLSNMWCLISFIYPYSTIGGGNINEGYEGMANVLVWTIIYNTFGLLTFCNFQAAFFHHDGFLDVVPSDVVAGLVLVRFAQQKRRIVVTAIIVSACHIHHIIVVWIV